ncbi:MAG TPA: orotate phosphoribosyltransferase [Spirochaetota bacterium]|jgi:orotate phosphoribosyltransferase|nr:MAG: Orotate phosphoribosyltransferase [Spirochaetes bacterium ADurb.Bin218]HON16266.1 orotate phosphoribosyltransferase [Spirochaetota bacterium]HOQ12816.1 orotate phosphoribosyltransferase [Spirochaetota bacterium]HRS63549.1 orotate phosphoribosyltransferase [Spirochaetota bacterium]HRU66124.1 orotate phosphoribosyltransferase [Spirochaetota bacterium]
MKDYKKEFIEFLLDMKSLKFGEFTLKSGRLSPYFLNTGMLYTGESVNKLGKFYASAIKDNIAQDFNVIFGPAYKGIPLAIATVNSLFSDFNINVSYSFNRKEAKDHGDMGLIVGKPLGADDKVILVDDVITAGTAVKESMEILRNNGNPSLIAVIVSVDRMEKGTGEKSAIGELRDSTGIEFFPIVNILDIMEFLRDETNCLKYNIDKNMLGKMEDYRSKYGVQ